MWSPAQICPCPSRRTPPTWSSGQAKPSPEVSPVQLQNECQNIELCLWMKIGTADQLLLFESQESVKAFLLNLNIATKVPKKLNKFLSIKFEFEIEINHHENWTFFNRHQFRQSAKRTKQVYQLNFSIWSLKFRQSTKRGARKFNYPEN